MKDHVQALKARDEVVISWAGRDLIAFRDDGGMSACNPVYSRAETCCIVLAILAHALTTGLINEESSVSEALSDLEGVVQDYGCPF